MLVCLRYAFFVAVVQMPLFTAVVYGSPRHEVKYDDVHCPDAELIAPCTCELSDDIYLPPTKMNCYGITRHILEIVLSVDFPNDISRLEVKGSQLDDLTDISFGGKSFEQLYLTGNHITSLDRDTFALSKEKLTFISLGDNQIESVRFGDLTQYPQLEILHLFNNHITSIDGLIGLPTLLNLRDLRLNANRITNLTSDTFFSIPNIRHLDLSWNFLTTLPSLVFMPLVQLEILNLKGNSLTILPAASLWLSTPIIRSIYLNRNEIETVEENAFSGIDYDTYIDISGNQIRYITQEVFGPLLHTFSKGWGILDVSTGNHLRCKCELLWFATEDAFDRHITYSFCYKIDGKIPHPINDKLIQELIDSCTNTTTAASRFN